MSRSGPLRVLLVTPTAARITGADRDWLNLANAFDPAEIRITWAGINESRVIEPYLTSRVVEGFVDLDFPPFTYLIQENCSRPRSAYLWAKILGDHLLRQGRPLHLAHRILGHRPFDLVVSNTAAATLGAVLAALRGLPHVWNIKECLDTTMRACRYFASWISRVSSVVVAPSRAVAAAFQCRTRVLPDGSPAEAIDRSIHGVSREDVLRRLNLPIDRPVVAQVGGICWWKGPHITAEAFARLAARGGRVPCSLLFLGKGSGAYLEEFDRRIAALPCAWREVVRRVHFAPDDYSYLAAADIVVHPSVLPDPFPNAVREAMLLGKPVIGSHSGGIPEMMEDGVSGMLFEPGNAAALAEQISRLLACREERLRMGTAATAFARRHFDIRQRKDAFTALFRALTNKPSAGSHSCR